MIKIHVFCKFFLLGAYSDPFLVTGNGDSFESQSDFGKEAPHKLLFMIAAFGHLSKDGHPSVCCRFSGKTLEKNRLTNPS
jgi:hypothetical protein